MPNYEIWHSTQDGSQEENTDFGLENISLENLKVAYATDDIQSVIVNNKLFHKIYNLKFLHHLPEYQ